MPTALVLSDVENAICSALIFHQKHPFYILREFGAVADLRERIRSGPSVRCPAKAKPIEGARYQRDSPHLMVDRVQMEVSVRHQTPEYKKAIDLVVLRPEPSVQIAGNGPGDVLEQIALSDIDVAIEVKTSQSCDPASRGSYVQDIYALLRLREHSLKIHQADSAHAYFVLIDRNDPVYGRWDQPKTRMNWGPTAKQSFVFRRKGHPNRRITGGFAACGLDVSATQPVHTPIWVKCFILDSTQPMPLVLYVFAHGGGPSTDLQPYVVSDGNVETDPWR